MPQETRDLYRHDCRSDQPLPVQYYHFVSRAITGHFGYSYVVHKPAYTLIMERMPATILLTVSGLVVAMVIALPLGILAAYHRSSWIDRHPLIYDCEIRLGNADLLARADVDHLVGGAAEVASGIRIWGLEKPHLPAFTLGVFLAPITMRLIRSGMIDVLSQDYIRVARAKGLVEFRVLTRHSATQCDDSGHFSARDSVCGTAGWGSDNRDDFCMAWRCQSGSTGIENQGRSVVQAAVIVLAVAISLV